MSVFINPFTDFGFKLIFGTEDSKPFLINFLNSVLHDEPGFEPIVSIEYKNPEHHGDSIDERGVVYDILCKTNREHEFIVEMQNARQVYFINRSIYYMSKAIDRQAVRGKDWNFTLKPTYMVSLLNFQLPEFGDELRVDAGLCNLVTNQPISDKMRFIFIQLPLFKIEMPDECANNFERWIYTLNNMETMDKMPFTHENSLFARLGEVTNYANLTESQRLAYDADLKAYRDIRNQIAFAREEAIKEGREEGIRQGREEGREEGFLMGMYKMAKAMLGMNIPVAQISNASGLSESQIREHFNLSSDS